MRVRGAVGLVGLLGLAGGCEEPFEEDPSCAEPGPTCEATPWCCPAEQTCWLGADGSAFLCHNAGAGQDGSACNYYLGVPSCGSGLSCRQLTADPGSCTPFCSPTDANHACPGGRQCERLQDTSTGLYFYLCSPAG